MSSVNETRDLRDWLPVHSRVSWGAILAGAAVAFASYILLNLLGVAIGFTVADNADSQTIGMGAAIWSIVALMMSLFAGGWVTSRCTTGEDTTEAVLYGAILWGVLFFLLVGLVGMGMGMGFNSMVGMSSTDPSGAQATMNESAQDEISQAAWWAFAGTLLSMVAAIGGSVLGMHSGHRHEAHTHRHVGGTARPAGT